MPGGAAAPERPRNGVYARPKARILADMKTFIHNAIRSICSRMAVEVCLILSACPKLMQVMPRSHPAQRLGGLVFCSIFRTLKVGSPAP